MLSKRIIPCLDVTAGRVVKGIRFKELRDAGDPVETAKTYEKQGADELVFLDITASSDNRNIMHDVVERTASQCFMPLTVGGGLRSLDDIVAMLHSGADKVSLNTAALNNPNLINQAAERFGNQCIVVAIDAKYDESIKNWRVFTHGGRNPTDWNVVDWVKEAVSRGAGEILLTSMDRDGTKVGYDNDLNRVVSDSVQVPIIASGGAGTLDHLVDAIKIGKADAVLAASIFHFGTFTIPETKTHMAKAGIPVRILD